MSKKVLVPGGTGDMGVYLVPELLKMGYEVDVISLDAMESSDPKLRYIKANAKDKEYIAEMLKNGYDAVVDFMTYWSKEQRDTIPALYLKNTKHYIFLSTYRVYANEEHPIKETSPRIFDVTNDEDLLNSEDYCIHKAQSDEFLKASSSSYDLKGGSIRNSSLSLSVFIFSNEIVLFSYSDTFHNSKGKPLNSIAFN